MSKRMTIDLETGEVLDSQPAGAWGLMSFSRLNDVLRAAGEIRVDETVDTIRIDTGARTISYRVKGEE